MVERQPTCNHCWYVCETLYSTNAPWPACLWTSRIIEDPKTNGKKVLVALHATGCHRLCQRMCRLPMQQGQQSDKTSTTKPDIHKTWSATIRNSSMDFIVKLPLSNSYDSVLTITDHNCTKAVILIPCNKTITAEGVAKLYLEHMFKQVGLPTVVIHDRDTHFMSSFTVKMCQALSIMQNASTVFHPRTNGQSEWTNQKLEQFLRFYTNTKQDNWVQFLSLAKFAFNLWHNKSTKKSPFKVQMGYNPRSEWTTMSSPVPQVTHWLEQIQEARNQAHIAMRKAQLGWIKDSTQNVMERRVNTYYMVMTNISK